MVFINLKINNINREYKQKKKKKLIHFKKILLNYVSIDLFLIKTFLYRYKSFLIIFTISSL